jgi:dTDP-4-amino-4,6-dideoxygalactose transaminase
VRQIEIMRPRLPPIEAALPYLRRIDETRLYSNYGPLWRDFCSRAGGWFGARAGRAAVRVVPTSSGTTAIEIALRARATPKRRYCLMPSYTFIASAHAVYNAGLEPFLLDIDPDSLVLTPRIAAAVLPMLSDPPAAVMPISAFGAPVDVAAWEAFEREHGIPVVFDAAAAATSLWYIGTQPLCVSLHATKVFGIGEGGAIVTADGALADELVAMTGFGFRGTSRTSAIRGGNFRISEYAAAMALAVLDDIEAKERRMLDLGARYEAALASSPCRIQKGAGTKWAAMTLNVVTPPGMGDAVAARLDAAGIQCRRWWGLGTHLHPAFSSLPRTALPVTEEVAPRVIGVPFHDMLTDEEIARVAGCLQ